MTNFSEIYEYIQAGHERPDMSDLYAKAYGLYCDSVRDCRPVMINQEQACANNYELIDILRDGGIRKIGLFAFEGEEDDIRAKMERYGYIYKNTELLAIRGRLFASCMIFEYQAAA